MNSLKTTVIHHSADFDGIFCREIARKFLPDAELIGWNFGDPPLGIARLTTGDAVYVLDLPVDRVFAMSFGPETPAELTKNLIWIDHHKSSIETHPSDIPGYRIDGVAACRLAWQWFVAEDRLKAQSMFPEKHQEWMQKYPLPKKEGYIDRAVSEPIAVRLAGEYDIWDKRDPRAEVFQHGLRGVPLTDGVWDNIIEPKYLPNIVDQILEVGEHVQYAKTQENADIITHFGFTLAFEGLTFLACNHARYNSHLFTAGLKPEHDALFGFKWDGSKWQVSLYHAPGKEHHDLSVIAVKHGGGGHRGACGFQTEKLPFLQMTARL